MHRHNCIKGVFPRGEVFFVVGEFRDVGEGGERVGGAHGLVALKRRK